MEDICPYYESQKCPASCSNFTRIVTAKAWGMEPDDLDNSVVKSDLIPGYSSATQNANFRAMRADACEINQMNRFIVK